MIEIRKTQVFEEWFLSLRDRQARLRIQARIDRLMFANPGQHRMLTRGVCEMKIDHGPGYRISRKTSRGVGAAVVRRRQDIAAHRHQGSIGDGG